MLDTWHDALTDRRDFKRIYSYYQLFSEQPTMAETQQIYKVHAMSFSYWIHE